jgi:hypothetical protein
MSIVLVEGEEKHSGPFEIVNQYLRTNTADGQEEITIQDIAAKLGVDISTLYSWAKDNEEFRQGLLTFKHVQEQGTFKMFDNRADAQSLAVLINQIKHTK